MITSLFQFKLNFFHKIAVSIFKLQPPVSKAIMNCIIFIYLSICNSFDICWCQPSNIRNFSSCNVFRFFLRRWCRKFRFWNRSNDLDFIKQNTIAISFPGTVRILNIMTFSPDTNILCPYRTFQNDRLRSPFIRCHFFIIVFQNHTANTQNPILNNHYHFLRLLYPQ